MRQITSTWPPEEAVFCVAYPMGYEAVRLGDTSPPCWIASTSVLSVYGCTSLDTRLHSYPGRGLVPCPGDADGARRLGAASGE